MDLELFKITSNRCFAKQSSRQHPPNDSSANTKNPWNCTTCTFLNKSSDTSCQICQTPVQHISSPSTTWSCSACTFINASAASSCSICGTPRPKSDPIASPPSLSNIPSNAISQCDHLQRILHGVKYYRLLNLDDNPSNIAIFDSFCNEVYNQILNDYQHVISVHSDHLEQINDELLRNDELGTCEAAKCASFRRYYDSSRRRRIKQNNAEDLDTKLLFYCELFDNIHHWLFHLYQIGMRVKSASLNEEKIEDKYNDVRFARMKDQIFKQRQTINIARDRLNDTNSKFQLKVSETLSHHQTGNEGSTFIDLFMNQVNVARISHIVQTGFNTYLQDEYYDTDAMVQDLDDISQSNIINKFEDPIFVAFIHGYMTEIKSYVIVCILALIVMNMMYPCTHLH